MTPETLRIDRHFAGVGRIARATGVTTVAQRDRINRMLDVLFQDGRLDILRALRDGALEFLQVYDAYRRRALHELPVGDAAKPLAIDMKAWITSLIVPRDASKKHVESLETSRRYFEKAKLKGRPVILVSDLPAVLEGLRESLGRKHPRSFNLARAAALAYCRARLKASHPIYLQVAAVEVRKLDRLRKKREGLLPVQMRGFFPNPGTDWLDDVAWSMATTGMHAEEFWGEWNRLADRVHIEGTKRGGRRREVPLVMAPVVSKYGRRKFEDDLRERTRAVQVYDLRRTFARWMESAGIPRTRRRLYMGHGTADTTDLYEHHEVTAFLAEDALKLRVYLNLSPTESPTMRLEKTEGV